MARKRRRKPTYLQRANSKLCFPLPETISVTENSLPARGGTSEVGAFRQAAPPRTNRNFQQPARRQPHLKNFDYGEKQTDPQGSKGTPRENRYRFALCHGAIQRCGTRPISDDVRAIRAVVEGGFYQGTGLRRCVPGDKNRSRNAGIRGQTDATARSIPSRGNELQPSREAVAHPFLGAESTRHALQIGEYDPRTGGCRAANRRSFRRVSKAMVVRTSIQGINDRCYKAN